MKSLQGKVALITGAGRGIGRAIADCFSASGAKVALLDLDEAGLTGTRAAVELAGGRAVSIRADVSNRSEVLGAVTRVVAEFGTLDILVNNAGILRDATLLKMTDEQWNAVVDVNLKGVFLCGQACAKVMAEKKYGKIVNISSVASRGNFGQSNYSATKAGVIGLTKTWALELSKYNINVNAVAPGLIATEMTESIPAEMRQKMVSRIPLGRMGATQDVAELIRFLASDEASYIQGEVISINGGFQI